MSQPQGRGTLGSWGEENGPWRSMAICGMYVYIYMCIYGLVWNVDCFHGTTDIYVDSVPNLIGIYGDIRRYIHI